MKIHDFEKQHDDASAAAAAEFAVEGDGTSPTTMKIIFLMIDAFLSVPCGKEEMHRARVLRRDWHNMKKEEDLTKWSTRDLERLMSCMSVIHEMSNDAMDALGPYLIFRKITGR
jgi:hypothetical protein